MRPSLPRANHAAVRLHDPELRDVFQLREIAIHQRTDIGVQKRRGGALVLAELGADLVGTADIGRRAAQMASRTSTLVLRIRIGVQKADRDRLDICAAQASETSWSSFSGGCSD